MAIKVPSIKIPILNIPVISDLGEKLSVKKAAVKDAGMGIAFVAAIAVLLLVAGYVISRMSSDRVHREKWKDYNDCGWA